MSRQREWQKRQIAAGRCQNCGQKRPKSLLYLCRRCQDNANELHMRLYYEKREAGLSGRRSAGYRT